MNKIEIEKYFSSYFIHSDKLSINSQKNYMRFFLGTIIPLVIAALLNITTSIIDTDREKLLLLLNIIIICLIIGSIFCSAMVHHSNLQKMWYGGRAVAESIKTMSWKYLNGVTPFRSDLDSKVVENQFIVDLRFILESNQEILEKINCVNQEDPIIITSEIRELRKYNWNDKKEIYLAQRIKRQRDWYLQKTKFNSSSKDKWFFTSITFQVLSLIAIIYFMENPGVTSNLVGLFAMVSTSILSWIQVKKFQELQQAYSTTALELDIIYHQGKQIEIEDDFIKFVEDAEKAISREHTLWIARRDHSRLKQLVQDK